MDTEVIYEYTEVEDIMCDQGIITAEINEGKSCSIILSATRLRLAVTLVAKAILPLVIKAYYAYLRNQQTLVGQLLPTVAAFIANSLSKSLASVHKGITYPLNFRTYLKQTNKPAIEYTQDDLSPEKSVDCHVLWQPRDEMLADVIFIHGLHGGLDRTWKQGQWRHEGHKLKDQTPVRRQSSGDLHVPARRQSLKRTISDIYSRGPRKVAKSENGMYRQRSGIPNVMDEWEIVEEVGEDEYYSPCWPQDWLPKDLPSVRVIALNYSTDVLWCPVWVKKRIRTGMVERSQEMIEELLKLGVGKRPIIWVGHSKGGLYIKQIILNAWELNEDRMEVKDIYKQSKGIMFYSVPHKGSILADFTLPLLRRSVELLEVQRNCDFVLDLHRRFLELCKKDEINIDIFSFIETSFTLMSFIFVKIVAYESAEPDIGVKCDVPLDHREICKPAGRDCFLYLELVKLIKKCMDESATET